jgi:hypothetical protein
MKTVWWGITFVLVFVGGILAEYTYLKQSDNLRNPLEIEVLKSEFEYKKTTDSLTVVEIMSRKCHDEKMEILLRK